MTTTAVRLATLERRLRAVARDVRRDAPLARHVSFRIGGPADLLVIPRSMRELRAACDVLFAEGIHPLVLGQGSNVLISDRGVRGVVVKIGKGLDRVRLDGTRVVAECGAGVPALALRTARAGLAGLEFAAGIPASAGGAVVMNAGAHGHAIDEVTESVEVLTPEGVRRLDRAALGFAYRSSVLQTRPWVVASVSMVLQPGDPATIVRRLEEWLALRGATQPIGPPSSGCVFRNPPGDHAGRLIDQAGLKGLAVGGARVSEVHANYIVNTGGATAADVLALVEQVRARLAAQAGVHLELEVKLLGEF
ncbi:MAG: UDP-N-acetylmuramate dehydrogenase [Armatimonadota bacterium]|nr:UDP-N-acetylmuramate dehydrogenase [Armatimonadota bacterium]MDR7534349.1 UDP-N-acetylmuramate dehydrogenase [Armatimonadota bacterium]MDR7536015.1 UDP-N-acetylmuramate dehydrogenase [Armatimonadota bacterium]